MLKKTKVNKKRLNKLILGVPLLALSGAAFGASIDHISHYTVGYTANPAQAGAVDIGTSAYYNPAGLMQLKNGRYYQLGLQIAFGEQIQATEGISYPAKDLGGLPNAMFVDKNEKRALYFTFAPLAGGAEMEYKEGVPTIAELHKLINQSGSVPVDVGGEITENWAEGSSAYVQATLGAALFVSEKVSVSAAARIVHAARVLDIDATGTIVLFEDSPLEQELLITEEMRGEREAWGYGGQFGLNYAATEKLNIGVRYDTKIKFDFSPDSKSVSSIDKSTLENGLMGALYPEYFDKSVRDLPAILAVGAQYSVSDVWKVFTKVNYYFNKDANLDREHKGSRSYKNGAEFALGSEYWLTDKWAWMVGGNYAYTGAENDSYNDSEFALDSFFLGTGVKYQHDSETLWTAGLANYWYDYGNGEGSTYGDVHYKKRYTAGGISYTKRF